MSSRITDIYLLVKEKRGKKKGKVETIWKGEFVIEIPERDQSSDHNYGLLRDPTITFHADPTALAPLNGSDYDYLSAVEQIHTRHQLYTSGRLAKAKELNVHDEVFIRLEKAGMVRGAIRYLGALEGKSGVRFGIEILDEKGRGKGTTDGKPNFNCGHKNAVYVTIDKVVVPDTPSKPSKDGKSTPKPFRDGPLTRSKAAGKEEPTVDSASGSTYFSRAREAISKFIWDPATVDPNPDHVPVEGYRFKLGDRVMMYSSEGNAVHGTVKWMGPVQFSKESSVDKPVAVAGIETDILVDPEKDFPGIHVDLTGSHNHGPFFSVKKSHGRIYIPEQVLEREPLEYGNLEAGFQKLNEEDQVAGQTAENSISKGFTQDQIEEQKKQLKQYEMEKAAKDLKRKDNAQQNLGGNGHSYPPTSRPRTSATVGNLSEGSNTNGGLHHGYSQKDSDAYQSQVHSEHKQSSQPVSNAPGFSAHGTSSPQVPQLTAPSQYGALSQQSSRFGSGGLGADPTQVDNPPSQELQPLSSQQQAESLLGVAVCVKSTPGTEGIIRWVGNLQDYTKGMVAGIELFEPMDGCTDGERNGIQYFYCIPGKALFLPMSEVQLLEGQQTSVGSTSGLRNPLSYVPECEEQDQFGVSGHFQLYIGDGRGIQGHHNSCYLDSTVFGLFALSDSFDAMLLEEPKTQDGKRIRDIILKRIVNPLRKYGAARHESVMELRNALEGLGAMKGVNKDEKDPEEFLNMLFKNILNVTPFISIKRPFGVEKEFFIQLFFEIDKESTVVPDTEKLLRKMFREQNISFTQIPSKLLLQMPRFGKEFKIFSRIIPALSIDVRPMLDIRVIGEQHCFICEEKAAFACKECKGSKERKGKFNEDLEHVSFCEECMKRVHHSATASLHNPEKLSDMGSADIFTNLELLSVICIETSHYVCFTRTPENKWLFHDSMANRIYDVFNIPRVIDVTQLLGEWVYDSSKGQRLKDHSGKQIPEIVRRFTQDIYMCVYINPDLDMYSVV